MRKRDRWVGQVWLARMSSQAGEGLALNHGAEIDYNVHQSITEITRRGYLIELEGVEGDYRARLLPAMPPASTRINLPAISYCGGSLRGMLSVAAYEVCLLSDSIEIAILTNRERSRWVQS